VIALKDKREAILQAMLELVAERGFHDAPMSLVAKRANTSAGISIRITHARCAWM
jgi:TetR/AcrR family transcriptional regulator, repressor of fatR-cypB operon